MDPSWTSFGDLVAELTVMGHVIAMASVAWVALARARAGVGRRWLPLAVVMATALTASLVFGFTDRMSVPLDSLNPLQEGTGLLTLERIHGSGAHSGAAFPALISALAKRDDLDLRDYVRVNVWLASLAVTLMFAIVVEWFDRYSAAVAAALLFGCNPLALRTIFSGLPATLLWVQLLLGVAAGVMAVDPTPAPRGVRSVASAAVVLIAALIAATRLELSLVVFPATAMVLWRTKRSPEQQRAREASLRVDSFPKFRLPVVAALLAWQVVVEVAQRRGELPLWARTAMAASGLLGGSSFDTCFALAGATSWVIVALAGVGLLTTLGRPVRWALLPWTFAALARVYACAAHEVGFEMLRYAANVLPLSILFTLEGWGWVLRNWVPSKRQRELRTLALGTTIIWLVWGSAQGTRDVWLRETDVSAAGTSVGSLIDLGRTPQHELRWLLEQVDLEPTCVFLSRVVSPARRDGAEEARWVAFGRPVGRVVIVSTTMQAAVEHAATIDPLGTCVRLYHGIDCARHGMEGACDADARGLELRAAKQIEVRAYADPTEYGRLHEYAQLAVYTVSGP